MAAIPTIALFAPLVAMVLYAILALLFGV